MSRVSHKIFELIPASFIRQIANKYCTIRSSFISRWSWAVSWRRWTRRIIITSFSVVIRWRWTSVGTSTMWAWTWMRIPRVWTWASCRIRMALSSWWITAITHGEKKKKNNGKKFLDKSNSTQFEDLFFFFFFFTYTQPFLFVDDTKKNYKTFFYFVVSVCVYMMLYVYVFCVRVYTLICFSF